MQRLEHVGGQPRDVVDDAERDEHSEIEPKIQKNVPNHGATTSLRTSPSPWMKAKSASSEMFLPYTVA